MKLLHKVFYPIILSLFIFSCTSSITTKEPEIKTKKLIKTEKKLNSIAKEVTDSEISLGIDELVKSGFEILKNKRVGLITNQTGVDSNLNSVVDLLFSSPNVNLVALFGPEHGVRGDVEGGKYVEFYTDSKTNLPVYSLYGKTRKPSEQMLSEVDVLVYDIQDIGVRSYTFISTLGLAIEAAAEAGIDFVILDRPNPLGGEKIEGNLVEKEFESFISQFTIPYVYGLTCGELAILLVEEKMVKTTSEFKLSIVTMKNWKRKMVWEDTNLEWIPTSPHIPHEFSPYFYPMTGILGELRNSISIGVGYTLPFQIIGAEWINGQKLANHLNKMNIPGLTFRPITFKPYYAFGKGKTLGGVQIHISDYSLVNLTKTQFYIIFALQQLYPNKNLFSLATQNQINMFNKGIGTSNISEFISNKEELSLVLDYLDKDVEKFKNLAKKYYLYN